MEGGKGGSMESRKQKSSDLPTFQSSVTAPDCAGYAQRCSEFEQVTTRRIFRHHQENTR